MLRDANDEMVLEVADNGDADFIVTHNLRDFAPADTLGIAVATPREVFTETRNVSEDYPIQIPLEAAGFAERNGGASGEE